MLGVRLDRFQNEVQPVRAVDLAGDAVIVSMLDVAAGLREVMQPVNPSSGIVTHHEHRESTIAVLVAVKQDEMIRAEVKHCNCGGNKTEREPMASVPWLEEGCGSRLWQRRCGVSRERTPP